MFNNIIQSKYYPIIGSSLIILFYIHYSLPLLVLAYFIIAYFVHNYQRGPIRTYNSVNLEGKIVIITGASAGIGKETAKRLAWQNATIIFACRDESKTMKVINEIKQVTGNSKLHYMNLQLDDYDNVSEFVKNFKSKFGVLDILINNAGIAQWWHKYNKNNHELVFATNYLGHFLLTRLLMDSLTKESRIIIVSSVMHELIRSKLNFNDVLNGKYLENYNNTKYCGVLLCLKLSQMLKNTKVVALHPGVIKTELLDKAGNTILLQLIQKIMFWFFRPMTLSVEEGAETTIYCTLMPYRELLSGGYYEKNRLSKYSKSIEKLNQVEELWEFSNQILKQYL
ncbi:unnamed protein product [Paramecium octaurelia]|uniref:Uncharacterized protein n=1 Tax=Paramecium octaurelia TaxID=43137 RepID=A0A8S1T0M9_PAROT|nr:unnamed protein product [Paramecium octaurelia]